MDHFWPRHTIPDCGCTDHVRRCRLDTLCRTVGSWIEFSHPRSDMVHEELRRSGLSPTIGGCLMRRLCVVGIAFAVATFVMTESVWALKHFDHKHGRHARGCTECCEVTSCGPDAAQSAPLVMPAPTSRNRRLHRVPRQSRRLRRNRRNSPTCRQSFHPRSLAPRLLPRPRKSALPRLRPPHLRRLRSLPR